MNLRAHHLLASLLIGAVAFSSLALLTVNPPAAQAACPTGSGVAITSPLGGTSAPVSQIVNLKAQSTPTTATGLSFMLLNPTQQALGEATQSGTVWNLNWDTRNQPNGSYQVMAIAHFGTATSLDCASSAVQIVVNNQPTQTANLQAIISPNTWQGPVGSSAPFSLDVLYTDQYGRSSHVSPTSVNWHSTLGSSAPNGGASTVFTAGNVLGTGTLMADAFYNGLGAPGTAQLKVTAPGTVTTTATPKPSASPTATPSSTPKPDSGNTSPSPTPEPTVSAADAARLAAMPTIFRPATPTNSDPVVNIPTLSCLEKAVGSLRFSEISSGKSQPTAAERKLAAACFSGPEQIPAVLAPIAPAHLTELPSTTDIVTLGSVKNQTITAGDGKKVNGLLVSGTGAPNSDIFLYFFSDPLVLRAQTDSHGKWSYVLETPLPAGHHEVYAVAEKDASNFVRTSAVPISIAAAAGNQDGSLVVGNGWSTAQIGFAGAAALLVLAALGVLLTILRRRRRPATVKPANTVAMPSATPPAPSTPAPASPAPGLIQPVAPAAAPAAPPVEAKPTELPKPPTSEAKAPENAPKVGEEEISSDQKQNIPVTVTSSTPTTTPNPPHDPQT